MWDKLASFLTGGLADKAYKVVKDYFPPDMSDEQKAQVKLQLEKLQLEKQVEANRALLDAEKSVNERVAQLEGTAKDLLGMPVIGRVVLFARGCQRPAWGFGVMYADLMWFSGQWVDMTQQQESALWVINLLVLGFLFGERAVKNVAPLLVGVFEAKKK